VSTRLQNRHSCIRVCLTLTFLNAHHRAAGNWLFAHRRWINPDDPDELERLVEGHRHLCTNFPALASCSLDSFVGLVGAISRRWTERCKDRPLVDAGPVLSDTHDASISGSDVSIVDDADRDEGDDFPWCVIGAAPSSAIQHAQAQAHSSAQHYEHIVDRNSADSDVSLSLSADGGVQQSSLSGAGPGEIGSVWSDDNSCAKPTGRAAGTEGGSQGMDNDALALWMLQEGWRATTSGNGRRGGCSLSRVGGQAQARAGPGLYPSRRVRDVGLKVRDVGDRDTLGQGCGRVHAQVTLGQPRSSESQI
jgi:hypothetical protein